ncbi:putative hydrolase [Wickerhamomyces ciferrii]|uniref:Hydrolase n=1 Tax=Wickerhamomyces ciferrii (strain ATCC 14091 / BCRC 22168 / CBS 111 / JCM 3599 / NBRC 0793 / NRRL Y-1031 F-60-10) TaxID=1206466 RepID=K0KHK1_WICCF|nr:putative hydrolase [Wickerhamomyces ciferrii]CCH41652.1 putative hydrolase [Wickerhamomyces ciferrii]
MASTVKTQYVQVPDGSKVFYREAGSSSKPTFLLLHGFPTSSHMFRNLIPILAPHFHVIAPDLPGFGFTETPEGYVHTFDNLAKTIDQFTESLKLDKFAVYIFDYGSPVAIRLALNHPERISAIVSQNGNAYDEGLDSDFWAPLRKYWATGNPDDEFFQKALGDFINDPKNTWSQYYDGVSKPEVIDPLPGTLDYHFITRPGQTKIQVGLFYDYQNNKKLYPSFQKYLRDSNVPVLVAWGKNDDIFQYHAGEAFKRDVKNLELKFYDTGHFALETHLEEISNDIINFLQKNL